MGLCGLGEEQSNLLECEIGIRLEHTYAESWKKESAGPVSLLAQKENCRRMATSLG